MKLMMPTQTTAAASNFKRSPHTTRFRLRIAPALYTRRFVVRSAAAISLPSSVSTVKPVGDNVFIKIAEEEDKTTGGVLLPTDARQKPTAGDVVAGGSDVASLKPGDSVVYSKFGIGVTDIEMQGQDYCIIKENDIIGIMPRSGATAADVPELKPIGERVLIKVFPSEDATGGGVFLPESAKERPMVGEVIRVGSGKKGKDGKFSEMKTKPGDKVLFFKYAGNEMNAPDGSEYKVLFEQDILGCIKG